MKVLIGAVNNEKALEGGASPGTVTPSPLCIALVSALYSDDGDGDGALVPRCPLSLARARPPRGSATIHTATIHRMPQLGPQHDDSTLGKTRMIK